MFRKKCHYFLCHVSKILIVCQIISAHNAIFIYLVPVYIKSLIPISNINIKTSTIKTLVLLMQNDNRIAGYFMGIHRYLRMRKVLQYKILSAEFNNIKTNMKLAEVIRYINDNKSWGKYYFLLKMIPPFLRVLRLEDSNNSVMETFITIR